MEKQAKIYTNVKIAHDGSHFSLFSHAPQSEDRVWTKQTRNSIDATVLLSRQNAIVQITIPRLSPWMSRLCTHTQSVTDVATGSACLLNDSSQKCFANFCNYNFHTAERGGTVETSFPFNHTCSSHNNPFMQANTATAIYILLTWLTIYKVRC